MKGAIICHSMEEVMKELEKHPGKECFVIGGQSIYEQFLPYCHTAHVTYIDYAYSADTHFPNLDQDTAGRCVLKVKNRHTLICAIRSACTKGLVIDKKVMIFFISYCL